MRQVQLGKRPQGNAEKMQAFFRLSLWSFRACRGISWKGTILKPARGRSKAYPLPHGVSPVSVPLIASQQGIHGKPSWAGTLSVSQSGAFPNYATRFRGGALRHAKFPKTSYKVQLLDTLKHAACVSLNRGRRRGLIFLSEKLLIFSKEFSFNGRRLKYFCQIAANRKTVAG